MLLFYQVPIEVTKTLDDCLTKTSISECLSYRVSSCFKFSTVLELELADAPMNGSLRRILGALFPNKYS